MKHERTKRTEGSRDMAFCGILIPDKDQTELIVKTFGCKRYVYNRFLNERTEAYKEDKRNISYVDQQNQLPLLKKRSGNGMAWRSGFHRIAECPSRSSGCL